MKMKAAIPVILMLAALLLPAAEEPEDLAGLVARALERNPRIIAAAREAEAYSFKIIPARTLPDPMVEFSLMNMGLSSFTLGMDPESGLGVSLAQDLPLPRQAAPEGRDRRQRLHAQTAGAGSGPEGSDPQVEGLLL